MTEQSGADYLRRLKADTERPAMSPFQAPAPTSVEADRPVPSQNAPERRRSPRYKCEGSAEFRVGGTDVRTWGTLTDLSIHGCYIEMTATFPVGAMVDLVLELSGRRVNVKGEVRVSYPFLGIGVAFRDVTPESERILQSMVASLLAQQRTASNSPGTGIPTPISAPLIANPAAALQAVADFCEGHSSLSKSEFLQLIRKNQTQPR
jgi:hypothetical protein